MSKNQVHLFFAFIFAGGQVMSLVAAPEQVLVIQ